MSKFLDKIFGPNRKTDETGITHGDKHVMADVTDEALSDAAQVLITNALNPPGKLRGHTNAVRDVGDKMVILARDVECLAIHRETGESHAVKMGTFTITVERVE